ncbi:MAG: hypothetical protein A4E23_00702 [Methanomethylovorans sp. PtaU1.Bin073]|nr:MAG: hypothetical protein A4E23_00702 [Methanomethylovorans sp. PtaU1.Bin073]
MFWVSVPVLSVQITVVEPRVSTDSSCFISAFLFAILLEARLKARVTVGSKPSGTLATMIPIAKIRFSRKVSCTKKPTKKKDIPNKIAIKEMTLIKLFNSFFKGVSTDEVRLVRVAKRPI